MSSARQPKHYQPYYIGGLNIMGAAGNKKPKKPKDKNHVPAYEKNEAMNGFEIGMGKKKKK